MKALIFENKVIQIETDTFDVAEPLIWVDCTDDCKTGWIVKNGELTPYIKPTPTIYERKAELAKIRYEHEIGGTTVAGITITTDREDQAMLNSAYTAVQLDPAKVIDYKTTNGWIQVDAATITTMARAVINHVQACFSRERELSEMLDVDIDTDLSVGWPQ